MKKLLLLAVALLGTVGANAQTFSSAELTVFNGGNGVVAVELENDAAVRDFIFTLELPTGVTLNGDATVAGRASEYNLATKVDGSTVTCVFYSGKDNNGTVTASEIGAGTGVVLNIPVSVDVPQASLWAEQEIEMSDVWYTVSGTSVTEEQADDAEFVVLPGLLGDANMSQVVNIQDVAAVLNYMKGNTTGVNFKAANVNSGDTVINIQDAAGVLNIMKQ